MYIHISTDYKIKKRRAGKKYINAIWVSYSTFAAARPALSRAFKKKGVDVCVWGRKSIAPQKRGIKYRYIKLVLAT